MWEIKCGECNKYEVCKDGVVQARSAFKISRISNLRLSRFENRVKGIKMFCRYCQWCLGLCWWCSKMHARKRCAMWPCLRKLSKRYWWVRRWFPRLCSWWNVHQSLWCCTRPYCWSSVISGKTRKDTRGNFVSTFHFKCASEYCHENNFLEGKSKLVEVKNEWDTDYDCNS